MTFKYVAAHILVESSWKINNVLNTCLEVRIEPQDGGL